MISLRQLAGGVAVAAITASLAGTVMAQEINSNMRGTVTLASGAPAVGATVTVLHVPSGTVARATTGSNGVFTERGLRPGGPYTVTITAPGKAPYRIEDVFLALAETYRLNIALDDIVREEAIVVTASALGINGGTFGSSSTFGLDTIEGVPTVNRDLKEVIKMDPSVILDATNQDAISIAGGNNRFLSLTVDGVQQNDIFGLNNSGFPTLRAPVSIDAISQLSVEKTPFDVEFSGFQSGSINIVTKSGTNDFHGSAFGFRRNSGLTGGGLVVDEWTYGGTFGGPIIKDKLFFFVGYDRFEATNVFDRGPAGSGAVNEISGVTVSEANQVRDIMQSVYGFDPLGFASDSLKEIDEKMIGKIDWNITDNHRASFTHQRTKGNQLRPQNSFGNNVALLSDWYNNSQKLRSYSFQLLSDWTDNLSTEVKISYKNSPTDQIPLGGTDFGLFEIETPGDGDNGSIFLGPDFFRHANDLENDTWRYKFTADYAAGDHLMTFGLERESTDIFNLFVPGSRGSYVFDSIADLQAQTPSSLFYQNAISNNPLDGSATWSFSINSLYLQDEWTVNDTLTVLAGVRYEDYGSTDDAITSNPIFAGRYGFDNTSTLSGRDIILPRVGFQWTPDDNTTFHGGFGLFSGGSPNVWISNNYSNDGITIDGIFLPNPGVVDGFNVPAAAQNGLVAGDGSVNALDPSFNIPSQWKVSLGVEKDADIPMVGSFLGDDWRFGADIIYSSVKDGVFWKDLTCGTPVSRASDGRPIYDCDPNRFDLLLTNTKLGHGTVISVTAEKSFWEGMDFRTSYSNQNIKDANSGLSSTATSNFGKNASYDKNTPILGTANFERKHRFTFNFDYRHNFFGDNQTRFTLFGESRSGSPFSYTFDDRTGRGSNSPFGISRTFARRDTQLFYVPTGPGDTKVDLSGIADQAAFFSFLSSSGLDKFAGQIAPRNGFTSPWASRWDFGIRQEIPGIFPAAAKGILSFDIRNIGNLIDNGWGQLDQIRFHFVQPVVIATVDPVTGQLAYSGFGSGIGTSGGRFSNNSNFVNASNWSAQVGLKYQF